MLDFEKVIPEDVEYLPQDLSALPESLNITTFRCTA